MWPRELPIDGTPEDVARVAKENSLWLKNSSDIPKLLILGNPGLIMKKGASVRRVGWCEVIRDGLESAD